MTEDIPRQYTTEDVTRIIRRALKMAPDESVSHQELLETAREMGIAPDRIEAAVALEAEAMKREKAEAAYLARKRSAFKARLYSFITVNIVVFIINVITPGPWWFQWVLLGTGIGLVIAFRKAYFPDPQRVKWAMQRSERLKARRDRRQGRHQTA